MKDSRFLLLGFVLLAALVGGGGFWWLQRPLALAGETVELSIEPGTVAARDRRRPGSMPACRPRRCCSTNGSAGRGGRGGSAPAATRSTGTPRRGLLQKMVRGDETLATVRLIEGWTFRQIRAELARAESLKPDHRGAERRRR